MIWLILFLIALAVIPVVHLLHDKKDERILIQVACGVMALIFFCISSIAIIDSNSVGHLKRIYFGKSMPAGRVIAMKGEKGMQAEILPPGFHFRPLLRALYDVHEIAFVQVPEGKYGLLTALDGQPLREGQYLADAWSQDKTSKMLDAEFFIKNGGQRGPQLTVLKPGKYPVNLFLFNVEFSTATNIETGEVGVIKSNVQEIEQCEPLEHVMADSLSVPLVKRGCIGVWNEPLFPGTYYLNDRAYTVTKISTRVNAWEYKGGYTRRFIDLTVDQEGKISQTERKEEFGVPDNAADRAINIQVEGWIVPLELRLLAQVTPENAPFVVASVGGIKEIEDRIITPTLRSVLRNVCSAGERKVFDLLEKRDELESLVEKTIKPEGEKAGISIKEARFGEPVIPPELLVARLRKQLAEQLEDTYKKEQVAQNQRIDTEKSRAQADQQSELVKAEIAVEIARQRKSAAQLEGEGEKLKLMEIATGQKAQVSVLGEERVLQLSILKELLQAVKEKPELIKVPHILVQGDTTGGFEGAAAILGESNLTKSLQQPQTNK